MKAPSISRYRHALALYNKTKLFVHGGFQPELASQPLDSLVSIDLSPFMNPKATMNNWVQNNQQGLSSTLKEEKNVLTQNDNITNMANTSKDIKIPNRRDMKQNI